MFEFYRKGTTRLGAGWSKTPILEQLNATNPAGQLNTTSA